MFILKISWKTSKKGNFFKVPIGIFYSVELFFAKISKFRVFKMADFPTLAKTVATKIHHFLNQILSTDLLAGS